MFSKMQLVFRKWKILNFHISITESFKKSLAYPHYANSLTSQFWYFIKVYLFIYLFINLFITNVLKRNGLRFRLSPFSNININELEIRHDGN